MLTFSLALAFVAAQPASASPQPDCSYDLDAMLALDQQAFDQDMDGGWRVLAQQEGCALAAADLIREWRHQKRAHASILYWHEGQMRAFAGQTDEAVALFELTYKDPAFDADYGWNHYVAGTIAFLERDRERLERAMADLNAVPKPSNATFTRPDGTVIDMPWPPNLRVLEAFERCWDKPYAQAYGTKECVAPDAPG